MEEEHNSTILANGRVFLPVELFQKVKSYFNNNQEKPIINSLPCSQSTSSLSNNSLEGDSPEIEKTKLNSIQNNFTETDEEESKIDMNKNNKIQSDSSESLDEDHQKIACQIQNDGKKINQHHKANKQIRNHQNCHLSLEEQNEFKGFGDIQYTTEGYCINYEDRNMSNIYSEENGSMAAIVGWLLIIIGAVFFIATIFSIFLAPHLAPTTHIIIEFLRVDDFYCFLVPLTLPITGLTIYSNWLSMKYLRHS